MSLTNRSRQYQRPRPPSQADVDDRLDRMQNAIDHIVCRLRADYRTLEQRVANVEQLTNAKEPPQ